MTESFVIKQGALMPTLLVNLADEYGDYVDISSATSVDFRLRRVGTSIPIFTRPATVVVPTSGQVEYAWQAGDTDTAGDYEAEFVVTTGGVTQIYPGEGYLPVKVTLNAASDVTDPAYLLVFATVADGRTLLAQDISLPSMLLAQSTIEMRTGLVAETSADPDEPTQYDELSDQDQKWLRVATIYQALWLQGQPDVFTRSTVTTASIDGESYNYTKDALTLAPYAQWALGNLSFAGGFGTIYTPRITPEQILDAVALEEALWVPTDRWILGARGLI